MPSQKITFFHSPQSRSLGVMTLLEELGVPYDLHLVNIRQQEQRDPAFLAVNPLGKVPTIRHGEAVVTEQVAICLYLADLFPEAGLAPALSDPLRGPYLRWFVFYAACFEPALVDHYMKRDTGSHAMSPYGSFEAVLDALFTQLRSGPYLLGDRYTALDTLWGTALTWTTGFGLVPKAPEIVTYLDKLSSRPAFTKANAADAALVQDLKKAGKWPG